MQPQILEVAPERPRRKRPLIVLVGMLVVGALTAATMSLAIFTDTASVDSNAFTAGKIDINATPASTLVAFTNQFPGKVVGPSALLVSNDGTGEMRYAMTSVSTNVDTKGLRNQLVLDVSLMTVNNWVRSGALRDIKQKTLASVIPLREIKRVRKILLQHGRLRRDALGR